MYAAKKDWESEEQALLAAIRLRPHQLYINSYTTLLRERIALH